MNSVELGLTIAGLITGLAYTVLIVSLTVGWSRLKRIEISASPFTFISVIIPLRNEEENIEKLLYALQNINYPDHLREFIFINDHSSDHTLDCLKKYDHIPGFKIIELPEGSSGKKAAIDHGIGHAGGKLITTLDADCLPRKNWLMTISSCYEDKTHIMIAGPVAILKPSGWLGSFQALELLSLVASGGGAIGINRPVLCNGANLTYEKKAFLQVGGFKGNEHIPGGDDIFLMEKIIKHFPKGSIGFNNNPESLVITHESGSLKAFLHQRFRWVAKSPAYKNPFLITSAIVVFLFNLFLLTALIAAFISLPGLLIFGLLFLLKCIIDFPILWKAAKFAGQTHLMGNYISFQFVYFIFVSVSGILGNFLSFTWKGRR